MTHEVRYPKHQTIKHVWDVDEDILTWGYHSKSSASGKDELLWENSLAPTRPRWNGSIHIPWLRGCLSSNGYGSHRTTAVIPGGNWRMSPIMASWHEVGWRIPEVVEIQHNSLALYLSHLYKLTSFDAKVSINPTSIPQLLTRIRSSYPIISSSQQIFKDRLIRLLRNRSYLLIFYVKIWALHSLVTSSLSWPVCSSFKLHANPSIQVRYQV